MPKGGVRPNSGRKKLPLEDRKLSKVVRVPLGTDISGLLTLADDLQTLVKAWETELQDPEKDSSPRYDKAKLLLSELSQLLAGCKTTQPVSQRQKKIAKANLDKANRSQHRKP